MFQPQLPRPQARAPTAWRPWVGSAKRRWGDPHLRVDQAAANRVARQVDAVAQPELLEDVRPVALDRLLAEDEQGGDLLRRVPLRDQLRDFFLARSQRVLAIRAAAVRVVEEVLDQGRDRARIQERLAAH